MGILNVTPDSFSDGGIYADPRKPLRGRWKLKPRERIFSTLVANPAGREARRSRRKRNCAGCCPLWKHCVAGCEFRSPWIRIARKSPDAALAAGAQIVNDISAFRFDPEMAAVVGANHAGVVLMHSRGNREELHLQPPMQDPSRRGMPRDSEKASVQAAVSAGIPKSAIVIDPGIGFGKRAEESLSVLRNVKALSPLECAVLIGTSRKSFIRKIARIEQNAPYDPAWGTAATVAVAVVQGAHIVRVHDVKEMRTLVDVLDAIVE